MAASAFFAAVYCDVFLEGAGVSVRVEEGLIVEGAAAKPDSFFDNEEDGVAKFFQLQWFYFPRWAAGMNSGPEERLGCVDVAQSRDDALVHQQGFDGGRTAFKRCPQIIGRKVFCSRFRSEFRQRPSDASKTACVEETEGFSFKSDFEPTVFDGPIARRAIGQDEAAGHA